MSGERQRAGGGYLCIQINRWDILCSPTHEQALQFFSPNIMASRGQPTMQMQDLAALRMLLSLLVLIQELQQYISWLFQKGHIYIKQVQELKPPRLYLDPKFMKELKFGLKELKKSFFFPKKMRGGNI